MIIGDHPERPVVEPVTFSRANRRRILAALALAAVGTGSRLAGALKPDDAAAASQLDRARRRKANQRKKRRNRIEKRRKHNRGAGNQGGSSTRGLLIQMKSAGNPYKGDFWYGLVGWAYDFTATVSQSASATWQAHLPHAGFVIDSPANPFVWVDNGSGDEAKVAVQHWGFMSLAGYAGVYVLTPRHLNVGEVVEVQADYTVNKKITMRITRLPNEGDQIRFQVTVSGV